MKKIFIMLLISFGVLTAAAQTPKTELYDLVKSFVTDSTGYENMGDWSVGKPKKFPVKWKADKLEMSMDTSINFYRSGTADITINGRTYMQDAAPVTWNLLLKGPRMGYSSLSIISSTSTQIAPRATIDSLFGKKLYKLSC